MNTFEKSHGQIASVTLWLLMFTLGSLGVSVGCALVGMTHAAESMRGATGSLAYAFCAVFCMFLVSVTAGAVRRKVGSAP